jgi:hypothetical protein
MSPINRILDRLQAVRKSGEFRWIARCPSHPDETPSLSVRELEDGRVLVHCFSGCGAPDVVAALGLKLADLFDRPLAHHLPPVRGGLNARELLELTAHESMVAALLVSDSQTRQLTSDEQSRLALAAGRLGRARAMIHDR